MNFLYLTDFLDLVYPKTNLERIKIQNIIQLWEGVSRQELQLTRIMKNAIYRICGWVGINYLE